MASSWSTGELGWFVISRWWYNYLDRVGQVEGRFSGVDVGCSIFLGFGFIFH